MTLEIQHHDHIDPQFLFELMDRQRLLPETIANNPGILVGVASGATTSVVLEGESLKFLILENRMTPNVLDVTAFILDRQILTRKDELAALQAELRRSWFTNGVRRVQAYVPNSRKNTKRILLYLGFIQETRDCGLRDLLKFGPKVEGCIAMGLLPSDPLRIVSMEKQEGVTHV